TPTDTLTPSITPTPSDTPAPSDTPTATETTTVTNTPTATDTATATLTPSATFTPSDPPPAPNTPTITPTPTDTLTPSITPTPTNTPLPTPVDCPDSLPSRFYVGMFGCVAPGGDANRLRNAPSLSGSQIGQIKPGEIFEVVGGPECGDGLAWLEVRYQGTFGWTAESNTADYWLEPLPGAAAFNPDVCVITVNNNTNKRSGPGTTFESPGQLRADEAADIIGKTTGSDGRTWYQLSDESWMREDVVIESGACNAVPEVEFE